MQRRLLGLLAADAGRVVSNDRLTSELWGETPPESASSALQVYVSRLRRALGDGPTDDPATIPPVRIKRRAPGYVLQLPDGALDAWQLARLTEAARAKMASDPGTALELLDQGLALVTGEPLCDVVDALGDVTAAEAQRLSELVMQAREARVEALLGVGNAIEAAAAAVYLLVGQPLRESVHVLRLIALYRSGRQTDALGAYHSLRERLADDIGVDPGPALRRLHVQLLNQDPSLDWQPLVNSSEPDRPAGVPTGVVPLPRHPVGHPLLGRELEVAALQQALSRTTAGRGGVWVVSGEAGIGKTRLLEEFARSARTAGTVVAEGRAQELSDNAQYWLWGQVFRNLPAMPRDGAVGVILGTVPGPVDGPEASSAALHQALAQLLIDEATSGPLLIVLEDVHWADEASLALLAVVAERAHEVSLLLLCTYRLEDAEPTGAFGVLLARLARTSGTDRLELRGLRAEQARELLTNVLGWQPDERTTATATERTAGNPFFLQEIARLVRESSDPQEAWGQVPGTVRDVLIHRLSRLPAESRRLLDVAAVVGRNCELGLLEDLSGLSAEQVDAGLAAGVSSGLVTEIVSPLPILHFPHALIREALYAQMGARARMRLHAAAGLAMSERPSTDVDDLAFHLMAGGDLIEPELAVSASLRAADRAMAQLALDHAQERLDEALPLMSRMPHGAQRDGLELALQTRRGTVVMTQRGFAAPEAEATIERALDLALRVEPGPDVFAAVYRRYLWLLMAGEFSAVERLATIILDHAATAEGAETRERFALLGRLARGSVMWCRGEAEPATVELFAALDLVDAAGVGVLVKAFGDPAVRIRMFLCHALASAGRQSEALAVANTMVYEAHLSGPADESDALATRGMMFAAFGDPLPARDDGIEGRRLGRLAGANLLEHFAALNESWGVAISGGPDASGAVQMARAATDGYRATGTRMHDPIVYTMLAEAEAATGHPERAAAAAAVGLEALDRTGSNLWRDRLENASGAALLGGPPQG